MISVLRESWASRRPPCDTAPRIRFDSRGTILNMENMDNETQGTETTVNTQFANDAVDMQQKKKGGSKWLTVLLVLLLVAAVGAIGYLVTRPDTEDGVEGGATVTKYDGKSREEIQKAIDDATANSRMTISVNAQAQLKDGKVRVNVINDENNRFYQSFKLEQDGKVLYKSKSIEQGKTVEWVDAPDAKPGEATITIQGHDQESGKASGNPQSVKIQIVDAD